MPTTEAVSIDFLSSIPSETLQASGRYGQVYDLQLARDRAERNLEWQREIVWDLHREAQRQAAARGAFGPLSDPESHPEVIKARAALADAEAQVAEVQAEVGGIVFLPAVDNLAEIEKRLASLNRRAAKINSPEITLTVTDEKLVLNYKSDDESTRAYDFEHVFAVLSGATPKIPGYEFLASITPTEEGNIVKRIPAIRYGMRHNLDDASYEGDEAHINSRTSVAGQVLDAIDLSRFHGTGDRCEHCGKERRRTDLYVVYNEETGEALQVGRTCLRLYTGADNPEKILKHLEQVFEFMRSVRESRGQQSVVSTITFLTHAAALIRVNDGKYRSGTGSDALINLSNRENERKDSRTGQPLWVEPIERDEQDAASLLNWVRDEWTEDGEYPTNVKISLATDYVNRRLANIAASAYAALNRWTRTEEIRKQREQERAEETPVIEGRIRVSGEVISTKWQDNAYGPGEVLKMLVRDDRGFRLWGTVPAAIDTVERGNRVSFTATAKAKPGEQSFGFFSRPTKAEILETTE